MTDEEKAKEYVIQKHSIDMKHQPIDFCLVVEFSEDIADFLAGLAEGRKESLDALICEQEHVEMLEKENAEWKERCSDYDMKLRRFLKDEEILMKNRGGCMLSLLKHSFDEEKAKLKPIDVSKFNVTENGNVIQDDNISIEKMTDEKKACKAICDSTPCKTICTKCKCYLVGLEEGIPKWHDLRKDPNDLPEERGEYWIKYDNASEERGGFYDVHYFEPDKPFYKKHWSEIGVIAWCELPKFEG